MVQVVCRSTAGPKNNIKNPPGVITLRVYLLEHANAVLVDPLLFEIHFLEVFDHELNEIACLRRHQSARWKGYVFDPRV